MFNSIFADIVCPIKQELSKDTEIQIKWQKHEVRTLNSYHKGDFLEQIEPEYNNTWIRTDYICNVCSKFTKSKRGYKFIRTKDQSRHYIYIRIKDSEIKEILSEEEFMKLGIKEYTIYD